MLNREKYAKEILDVVCSGHCFAKVDGKITECGRTDCDECDFGDSFICMAKAMEWANSEYVEPPVDWSKVAVDTPILVKDCECGNTIKVSHDIGIMNNNNAPNYCSKCGCRFDWSDEE